MKVVGLTMRSKEATNGCSRLSAAVHPMTVVTKVGDVPKDANLIICFGIERLNELLGVKHRFNEARRQMFKYRGAEVTVTFKSKYVYPEEGMPELMPALAQDILWAVASYGQRHDPEFKYAYKPQLKAKLFGFDLETTGFEYWNPEGRILTGAAASDDGTVCATTDMEDLLEIVNDPNVTLIGHNIKFDYNWWLSKCGPIRAKAWSTDIAEYLINDNLPDNTLGFHTTRHLNWNYHKEEVDVTNLEAEDIDKVLKYNAKDALGSRLIYTEERNELSRQGLLPLMEFLMDLVPVFAKMETRGVFLDQAWTMRVGRNVLADLSKARQDFCTLIGKEINMNSPKQVADVLYDDYGFTDVSNRSTNKDVLKTMLYKGQLNEAQREVVDSLFAYRKTSKLWTGYFKKYPELTEYDGRVHTSYGLAKGEYGGTVTGRTSSRNPNLQNIPLNSEIRGCFAATPGYLWFDADYTGLEMCVVADLAREHKMLNAMEAGRNIHTHTMSLMYDEDYDELQRILDDHTHPRYGYWKEKRVAIKRINFGILYGIGPTKLAHLCSLAGAKLGVTEASEMIEEWLLKYSSIAAWLEATRQEAIDTKEVVAITGQRRRLPGADGTSWWGGRAVRQACNFPVQHTASTILLTAMYLLDRHFENEGWDCHLLMNVHDQTAGEFRNVDQRHIEEVVKWTMEEVVPHEFNRRFGYQFTAPLRIDLNVSDRWS